MVNIAALFLVRGYKRSVMIPIAREWNALFEKKTVIRPVVRQGREKKRERDILQRAGRRRQYI